MVLKRDGHGAVTEGFPWLPTDGGFVCPQFHRLADTDWLTLSQDVKPWHLEQFGFSWQLVSPDEFVAALAAQRG